MHLHVQQRKAGKWACCNPFLDAFFDRGNEFPRNSAAPDLIFENQARSRLTRLDREDGMPLLPAAPALLDVFALGLGLRGDRLAVGDFRRAGVGLHAEFPLEPVNKDLQM